MFPELHDNILFSFRLLLLGEICVLRPGVESSKLDTLQSVTMPFYNNGAFTSCQALGLSV